jgi:hypothetical protein
MWKYIHLLPAYVEVYPLTSTYFQLMMEAPPPISTILPPTSTFAKTLKRDGELLYVGDTAYT